MARNPYPQGGLAVPFPDDDDQGDEVPPPRTASPPVDEPATESEQDQPTDDGDQEEERAGRRPITYPGSADVGAGWLLGLLLWAGVVLPFLQHGPKGVGAWWAAKFANRSPDGTELP